MQRQREQRRPKPTPGHRLRPRTKAKRPTKNEGKRLHQCYIDPLAATVGLWDTGVDIDNTE